MRWRQRLLGTSWWNSTLEKSVERIWLYLYRKPLKNKAEWVIVSRTKIVKHARPCGSSLWSLGILRRWRKWPQTPRVMVSICGRTSQKKNKNRESFYFKNQVEMNYRSARRSMMDSAREFRSLRPRSLKEKRSSG